MSQRRVPAASQAAAERILKGFHALPEPLKRTLHPAGWTTLETLARGIHIPRSLCSISDTYDPSVSETDSVENLAPPILEVTIDGYAALLQSYQHFANHLSPAEAEQYWAFQDPDHFIRNCSTETLKDLQNFAKLGGPDN